MSEEPWTDNYQPFPIALSVRDLSDGQSPQFASIQDLR